MAVDGHLLDLCTWNPWQAPTTQSIMSQLTTQRMLHLCLQLCRTWTMKGQVVGKHGTLSDAGVRCLVPCPTRSQAQPPMAQPGHHLTAYATSLSYSLDGPSMFMLYYTPCQLAPRGSMPRIDMHVWCMQHLWGWPCKCKCK